MFELAVLLGVGVAIARRSDLSAIAELRFRGLWFCFVAFALKLALFALGAQSNALIVAYGVWLQLAVTITLLVLVGVNWRLPGMPVVFTGLLLNLLVIVFNGERMPVTAASLRATGQGNLIAMLQRHEDPGHTLADSDTRLPWLADWIPINALNHKVVSPGDIAAALGLTITVGFTVPTRKRREGHAPPAQAE